MLTDSDSLIVNRNLLLNVKTEQCLLLLASFVLHLNIEIRGDDDDDDGQIFLTALRLAKFLCNFPCRCQLFINIDDE